MTNKAFWGIGCAVGSGMIGFSADRLNTPFGIVLFALGVAMVATSILQMTRPDTNNQK